MTGLLNPHFYRPEFSVLDIPDLFRWHSAKDEDSITHTSGAVSAWLDKGPNNIDLIQASAGAKPTWSETGHLGTEPALTLDGGDFLENTAISLASGTLIHSFAVIRPTGTKNYNRVVAYAAATGFDYSGGYIPIIRRASGDTWDAYNGGEGTSTVTVNPDTTAAIGSVRTSSTHYYMIKNGTPSSTVALGFPAGAMTRLAVGAAMPIAGGGQFRGQICEQIDIAGATPHVDIVADIMAYFASEWTLS